MKFRRAVAVAAALTAAAVALAGCSGSSPSPDSAKGGTLTIGSIADLASFDPAQAHIGHYLQYYQPVYDSLVRRKPDGTLTPMLATKWTYDSDNTHLTLSLRSDVTFTDGTKLDAAAVKVNLDRFRTGNGPDASTLSHISDVSVKDTKTVVISLKSPDPSLLSNLGNADGFIASPKAIDAGKIATDPVGSGPYTLDKAATVVGSTYTFVKRAGYWDPSLQVYDKIVVKAITDRTAMLNALLSGQVDATLLTPKTAAQGRNAGLTEYRYPVNWSGLLIFDRGGKTVPALADARVRQAINYAIDKQTLLKQVDQGLGSITGQIFGPTTDAYVKSLDDAYPYDAKKAKELLAEAGYGAGFSLTMPVAAGTVDPAMQAGIGQNLKDVGITVNWVNVAAADYISSLAQGKFPMAWFQLFQGSPWDTVNQIIAPNATYNPFHTEDAKVDDLVAKVQTGTAKEQASASQDLNRYITEQAWFAPFYRPDNVFFTDSKTTVKPQAQQGVPSIYYYAPKK